MPWAAQRFVRSRSRRRPSRGQNPRLGLVAGGEGAGVPGALNVESGFAIVVDAGAGAAALSYGLSPVAGVAGAAGPTQRGLACALALGCALGVAVVSALVTGALTGSFTGGTTIAGGGGTAGCATVGGSA